MTSTSPTEPTHQFLVEVEAVADDKQVALFLSELLAKNFGGISKVKAVSARSHAQSPENNAAILRQAIENEDWSGVRIALANLEGRPSGMIASAREGEALAKVEKERDFYKGIANRSIDRVTLALKGINSLIEQAVKVRSEIDAAKAKETK